MYDAKVTKIESDKIWLYDITCEGRSISFAEVLEFWQSHDQFRRWFTQVLADAPFAAYRWETPALSTANADSQPFQFVLINSPRFCSRRVDVKTFESFFTFDDTASGIVTFASLGGDALLIVPSPRTAIDAYGHLAAFIRKAPESQLDAFWQVVSATVTARISHNPLWLSTAGGGVAWLHVRLDKHPKYYGYGPFKTLNSSSR